MKAKLVKYPFNEKKYRWDTYAQEKEFEYYWDESLAKNFDTIEPYIKVEPFEYDPTKIYAKILLNKNAIKEEAYSRRTFTVNNTIQTNGWYYSGENVTNIAYSFIRQYLGTDHIIWGQNANEAGAFSVVRFYISNYGRAAIIPEVSQLTFTQNTQSILSENDKCCFV